MTRKFLCCAALAVILAALPYKVGLFVAALSGLVAGAVLTRRAE